jgi:hypothetical protein
MKLRFSLTLLLLIALAACSTPQPAAPTTAPTAAPEVKPTAVPPTQPPPTAVPPTNTSAPAATEPAPTEPPPAPTDTLAPQPTDTAAAAPAATKLRPTPTSAGPLTAAIYVANCRSAPTADKPGRIIVQISVEASGGNGRYRYFYQDKESPTKFIEVAGEKGTRIIGEVQVTSGDGQELKKEFDIAASQLTCP